ncbi:MAG: hypothetical protein HY462_00430 [Parcubacteria group bacterium]|nr:hypothetical protein [Parcubacteria group bacterium]
MDKLHIIREARRSVHGLYWYLLVEGALLMALGVLVIFYPGLLILLAAFFFVLIGLASLWAGVKIWRFVRRFDKFFDLF